MRTFLIELLLFHGFFCHSPFCVKIDESFCVRLYNGDHKEYWIQSVKSILRVFLCDYNRKKINCFSKWTGEQHICDRWLLKSFISCFPHILHLLAKPLSTLWIKKCGSSRSRMERGKRRMMRWNSFSSQLLFLCLYFSLWLKERPWGFEQRVSKDKRHKGKTNSGYFGMRLWNSMCVSEKNHAVYMKTMRT